MDKIKFWFLVRTIRISRWEYWSSYIIYLPALPYLLLLWMKSKSFFFFNAANPGIAYGGFLMESKWTIHNDAPAGYFPDTMLVHPAEDPDAVFEKIKQTFSFPFIVKPDVGSQGRGVAVVKSRQQWYAYHRQCPVPYLVQEKIVYPMEAGVFYVRDPTRARGKITGIVQKHFIQVTGNGYSTMLQLLVQNPRYLLQVKSLQTILGTDALNTIIPEGETRTISDIGNHARGSLFVNASEKISEQLTTTIDNLCRQFKGFYFGRLDIRFHSWEHLEQGKDFAVIELNGSGSEPTHIYDPDNTIFEAWKEIRLHWKLMQEISSYHHATGVPYLTMKEGIQLFRDHLALNEKLAHFHPRLDDVHTSHLHATVTT